MAISSPNHTATLEADNPAKYTVDWLRAGFRRLAGEVFETTGSSSATSAVEPSHGAAGLKRDASMAFVLRVAGAAVAYLSQIVLARMMGEHGYGIYAFAWIWVIVLGRAVTFGFGESVVRFLPRYEEQGMHGTAQAFLRSSRGIVAFGSIAVAMLAALVLQFSPPFVMQQYIWPLTLAMICLPLFAQQELYEGIARAKGWNILALLPVYILRPAFILVAFAGFVLAGTEATVQTAMLSVITALVLATLVQVFLVERRLRSTSKATDKIGGPTGLWFKASLPLFAVHWCEELMTNADMVVLGAFVSPDQMAIYFAASKTLILAAFVPFAVGVVIGRRFSIFHAAHDMEGLREVARAGAIWTFWPTVAAVSLILALGYPMLWLFGSAFVQGYPVLLVLGAGFIIRSAFGQAEDLLVMLGHQRINLQTVVAALVVNVLLNIFLIPQFGLLGAAAATSITITARAGVLALLAYRLVGVNTVVGLGVPLRSNEHRSKTGAKARRHEVSNDTAPQA